MKRLIFWLLMALGTLLCSDMAHAQFLPVTTPSSCVVDGSGSPIVSGTMVVVGTDAQDNQIPYRAGTSLMATTAPITRGISNGQLLSSLQLADPASTSPTNVLYRFSIMDNVTKRVTVYKQIVIANNDSGNFNFCKMNPLPFTTQVQFAAAPFSFSGDWNLLGNLSVALDTTLTGKLTVGKYFQVQGNAGLPSSLSAGTFYMAAGLGSPIGWRTYIGDGTGWKVQFAKRVTGTDTVLYEIKDSDACHYIYKTDGTLGAKICNDGFGGFLFTNSSGNTVQIDGTGNLSILGSGLCLFEKSAGGGTIKVCPPSTASSPVLTLPSATGTISTLTGTPNRQYFSASGTFTISSTALKVCVTGGGGAGGGATTTTLASGTGGAAAGTACKLLTGLTVGNTLTVTIGSGGTGVANSAGNSGTNSTIASGTQTISTLTGNAGGGGAATGNILGNVAGTATGGDTGWNYTGGMPTSSLQSNNNAGSQGGASYWGPGGPPGFQGAGTAASNCGSGGGGAGGGAAGTVAGGAGAAGCALFEWIN